MVNIKKGLFYFWKFILLLILLCFGFVSAGHAVNVTLKWNPNSESNLAGYRVFAREKDQSYDYDNPSLEVEEANCSINNLDENITYYFVVRAFDTNGFESGDSNEVCLESVSGSNDRPPIAIIAENYIEAVSGTTVTLDGSRSTDADDGIVSYHWRQIYGPPVVLSDHNLKVVSFTAPESDQYGSNFAFRLTVTDFSGHQSTADCFVYVILIDDDLADSRERRNQAPSVNAGENQIMFLTEHGTFLNGNVSDDGLPNPPAAVITAWYQVSGPGTVSFMDARAVDTIISFTEVGRYALRLLAYDGESISSDDVIIIVLQQ